ncbi:beta-glucosidase [Salinibacter ruber]|uniref:glycoside hydrolase family 3 N-terminal domain-containing protein n=1 Tax=Salinibacter ruber TaxID=146919 RepID=UPI00216A882B|nr:glycoside hydrolase family 3 N-terminal domain-containing protein [Salinibacter ruber]MCS4153316.1 beta-glucosidase [Salinibacter ruber]
MTLEEKMGQLAQYPSQWSDTGPSVPAGRKEDVRAGKVGSFLSHYGAEATQEMQEIAVTESRLGIPLLFAYDVVHGYRTIFPIPLGEASSFNPDLARRTARAAAREATAGGVHWTFAPMIDLSREPRWGRVMEGAGEDPYLNSILARARVQGFQGPSVAADTTVMATAKHFVGYGAPQAGRDYHTVDISKRTLHEIYLPPVYAALDAGARSVMPGFNEIAGIPMHAHDRLINGLLRNDWNWDGVVVSDYTAIWELKKHGIADTDLSAGIQALEAGVDVDMVSGIYGDTLATGVQEGRLRLDDVNRAVRRVLRAKWDAGLFEDPFRYGSPEREDEVILSDSHRDLARTAAQQSMVLLKNEDEVLPLGDGVETLAVIGPLADDARTILGEWAGAGRAEDAISVLDALQNRTGVDVRYVPGLPDVRSTDMSGVDDAVDAVRQADAAILVLGEHYSMSGEAASRTSIDLPGRQQDLADAVTATGTPTAAVLLNGRPLALSTLDDSVPAILEAWYPGTEAGPAVADVLFGEVNPSGKLPMTFPRETGQIPIFYNHKNTGRPPVQDQDYTSTYLDTHWTPLYPFGHGLSYTSFAYGAPKLNKGSITINDTLRMTVDVSNTGDRAGTEVVQLYVEDSTASVTPRVKELRGMKRVHLSPGETKTVRFAVTPEDLTFIGPRMRRIVEPGHFHLHVGTSSADVQTSTFQLTGSTTPIPVTEISSPTQ